MKYGKDFFMIKDLSSELSQSIFAHTVDTILKHQIKQLEMDSMCGYMNLESLFYPKPIQKCILIM